MAITVTEVGTGVDTRIFDVTSTADGDTASGNIAHGLPAAPEYVIITPLKSNAIVAGWYASTIDATNVVLTKTVTAASGVAGAQVRVTIKRRVTADR